MLSLRQEVQEMAKQMDPDLERGLREESERTKNDPYPTGAKFTRPNGAQSRRSDSSTSS